MSVFREKFVVLAMLCNSGKLDIIIGRWTLLSGLVGTKEIWHSYSYNMLEEERLIRGFI
jgi:hypothetical protein